jgi:uncharacterized repeat protein (TIGR01451 family)
MKITKSLMFATMLLILVPAAFAQITDVILEADNTQPCGASATVTPTIGDPAPGIQLSKPCPTATNAEADALIISPLTNGTTPISTVVSAGFDIQNNTHCGAGAPRFEFALDNNTHFVLTLGCQAGHPVDLGNGFSRISFTAADIAAGVVAAGGTPASTITQIFVLFDEGTDTPPVASSPGSGIPGIGTPGTAVIDNIMLNGAVFAAAGSTDLMITKTVSTPTPALNIPFTFTVTATNNGPSGASNVMVTDTFPVGLTLGAVTTSQGTCTAVAPTITCTVGALASGASATITIGATATAAGGPFTNSATVTDAPAVPGTEVDPNPANNTATASVTVAAATADLAITKTGPATTTINTPFNFIITATNNGPSAATNVMVTDVLPAGLTFVSATPSQGTCTGTTTVTCSLGGLASGASATVTLTVTSAAATPASNTATVTANEVDPNPANNTATAVAGVVSTIPALSEWALLALAAALAAFGALRMKM